MLYTATLCLLALGAVMVYSASSAENLLAGARDPSYFLKRYLAFAVLGLLAMRLGTRRGLRAAWAATPALLVVAFLLTLAVMIPGVGVEVNGATRWLGAGPLQFQPSELLKVALVLYAARLLAGRPASPRQKSAATVPLLVVVAAASCLLLAQPDMGTAMVICFSIGALLVAAGTPARQLARLGGALAALALIVAVAEPYRRERLTVFLDPWAHAGDSGFQAVQALIAVGSGGLFGVGLGESVQKVFYLPEAHTDMVLAIVAEELGWIGITAVAALYGLIACGGLRAARLAGDRYAKLLAAGLTALILCQATLNFFAVLGMAPLTGVPLPFVSYGSSNLVVLLGAMGLVLNVASRGRGGAGASGSKAATAPALHGVVGGKASSAQRRHSGRRHRGARGAGARHRRRAAG
jgi:cell division protein FtsW